MNLCARAHTHTYPKPFKCYNINYIKVKITFLATIPTIHYEQVNPLHNSYFFVFRLAHVHIITCYDNIFIKNNAVCSIKSLPNLKLLLSI